jgi:HK97 gp10 family phage protein
MASTKRMFTASFTGKEKLVRNCQMLRVKFPEALYEANMETATEIFDEARRNIKTNDSYASGELYDSIVTEVSARGLAIWVGSTSHYAPYVEFGTRPHFPPLDAIRQWCQLKGIPESAAFPIARKISEVGTSEAPFLAPALKVGQRNHLSRIRKIISLMVKGVLGRAA